jgi:hypothetical protein
MSTDSWNRLNNRPCRHLRSKEMFYDSAAPPDERSGSGIFWCHRTTQCLGPDGKPVDDEDCRTDRGCYEP